MHTRQEFRAVDGNVAAEGPATLAGIRVFVAEDEPILLMALEDALCELGCTIIGTAGRVTDCLAFVEDHTFDIAVLDGSLADGNIDPVVDLLVARGTPFVMATGFTERHFSASFSAAVFLRKPYTDANLGRALLRALGKCSNG